MITKKTDALEAAYQSIVNLNWDEPYILKERCIQRAGEIAKDIMSAADIIALKKATYLVQLSFHYAHNETEKNFAIQSMLEILPRTIAASPDYARAMLLAFEDVHGHSDRKTPGVITKEFMSVCSERWIPNYPHPLRNTLFLYPKVEASGKTEIGISTSFPISTLSQERKKLAAFDRARFPHDYDGLAYEVRHGDFFERVVNGELTPAQAAEAIKANDGSLYATFDHLSSTKNAPKPTI